MPEFALGASGRQLGTWQVLDLKVTVAGDTPGKASQSLRFMWDNDPERIG
jgi:hypothetical protein